jgi:hypothetical protein
MRKLIIVLVALTLCLQVFSGTVVYGAVGKNIEIISYKVNDTSIREGEAFKLTLGLKNLKKLSPSEDITNLSVDIDLSSDFYCDGSYIDFLSGKAIPAGDYKEFTSESELIYKGAGNQLVLNIEYEIDSTTYTESLPLPINQVVPTDNTPSAPVDTSKYVPKLGIVDNARVPIIAAGSSYKLKYTVKNTTGHQARDVDVSLKMVDETKAPLVFENFILNQTISTINGGASKEIIFDIRTLKTSPEGIFALKLNYEFENAFGHHSSVSETVYIRIQNNNVIPKLTVGDVSIRDANDAAGSVFLDLTVKNLGTLAADDVKVTLGGLKSGGFTTYNSTDVKYIDKVGGRGSQKVSYQLMMPTGGAAASNELSVKLEYKDSAGTAYTEQNQVFIPAGEGEGSKPDLAFEKIVSPQSAIAANQDFNISFDLKNKGGAAAKSVKVTLSTDTGIITKSLNPVYINNLDANKAESVTFKLFAQDEVTTKNFPIALNVEYEDIFGVKYNGTQYVGVFVENDSGKTVPRIIIDNYSMDPFPVNAGDNFKLNMSFLNTSKSVDVSNIKVTITSEDGTFTPSESGNTFYLESIPAKGSVEREIMLSVKSNAEQKSYMMTVDFEYEDNKGNPFTAKETMSVNVLQSPRLVASEINIMPDTFVGQPTSIYLDFYNMGKSILYNLMITVEGDFEGENLSYYVGNFESGRTDYYDASITPMMAGTQTGSVLFTFEDANGKPIEVRKEFTLNVMEMMQEGPMLDENGMPIGMEMGMPGMDGMPGATPGLSLWVYAAIGVVVLAAGVVVFVLLRKRHARRKEMSLDE